MRIKDMQARGERVRDVVVSTLEEHFDVTEHSDGVPWMVQPFLSITYHRAPSPRVRAYLADQQRHPIRWRRYPVQWPLVGFLTSATGLRATSKRWFYLKGSVDADLVVVGNQRLRLLSEDSNTMKVVQKAGFDAETLTRDAALRAGEGPWPQVLSRGERWFTEPWLDGWPLPHLPLAHSRKKAADIAWEQLRAYTASTVRDDASQRLDTRIARLHQLVTDLTQRHPRFFAANGSPKTLIDQLHDLASPAGAPSALTHGDAQPGNVFMTKSSVVYWIDWEHQGRRSADYDYLGYKLQVRRGGDLAKRLISALDQEPRWWRGPKGRVARRAAIADQLLDEWVFYLRQATRADHEHPDAGLWTLDQASREWVQR